MPTATTKVSSATTMAPGATKRAAATGMSPAKVPAATPTKTQVVGVGAVPVVAEKTRVIEKESAKEKVANDEVHRLRKEKEAKETARAQEKKAEAATSKAQEEKKAEAQAEEKAGAEKKAEAEVEAKTKAGVEAKAEAETAAKAEAETAAKAEAETAANAGTAAAATEASPSPDAGAETEPTTFVWANSPSATSVTVAGSFDAWSGRHALAKSADGTFAATIPLAHGKYVYKFVVDGEWAYDFTVANADDGTGNVNNVVVV